MKKARESNREGDVLPCGFLYRGIDFQTSLCYNRYAINVIMFKRKR